MECFVKDADMPPQRAFAVDINRRADFLGYFAERNVFTVKLAVPIFEVMHAKIIRAVGAVDDRPSTALPASRAAPYVEQA